MKLTKNDIVECTLLMDDTWNSDDYTYERNEMKWVLEFINHVSQQEQGNNNYLAIKALDSNGMVSAFMTCSTFNESYNGSLVMNVDDMIVDYNLGSSKNAKDVKQLFDIMVDHCKEQGIKHWRADSIHESEEAKKYIEFLNKSYEGSMSWTFRGKV